MNPQERPLTGLRVSLSVSESEDTNGLGFPPEQVNRITVQIAAGLVGQGATVIFGHDWREDGVMEAVHAFAQQMQPPMLKEGPSEPLLQNMLAWPDKPHLPAEELVGLSATLRVESKGLPIDVSNYAEEAIGAGRNSDLFKYLRARALTYLREQITAFSGARLCIGGRISGSEGRCPGVIEEAYLAVEHSKPLYLSGLLGGASRNLIQIIENRQITGDFFPPASVALLYDKPPIRDAGVVAEVKLLSPGNITRSFQDLGLEGLSRMNGLTVDENTKLFHSPAVDDVVGLMLLGLARLKTPPRG
ncbi:MAG: hypothetical protein ACREFF_03635 [Candidatus Udaeobacter sp.]